MKPNRINLDVQAYLDLLDLPFPQKPTLSFLEQLHERHLLRVPFENLNIHLGRPIHLDIPFPVRQDGAPKKGADSAMS